MRLGHLLPVRSHHRAGGDNDRPDAYRLPVSWWPRGRRAGVRFAAEMESGRADWRLDADQLLVLPKPSPSSNRTGDPPCGGGTVLLLLHRRGPNGFQSTICGVRLPEQSPAVSSYLL